MGFEELSTGQGLLAILLAASLAIAVFVHADRRGNKHATAWGIGVFLLAIVFLPLYILRVRRAPRR